MTRKKGHIARKRKSLSKDANLRAKKDAKKEQLTPEALAGLEEQLA